MANNNGGQKLVSTIGCQYFGIGEDKNNRSLSVGYLENNISIGIFKPLPQSQQTDKSKFDYTSGSVIYLKGKQAKSLYRLIKKAVSMISDNVDFDPMAISSADNLIEVANGTYYGLNNGIAIAIYNEISQDKTCGEPSVFQFTNESYITKYDRKTGKYELGYIDSDIDYFMDQLHEFSKSINNASSHAIKKEMSFNISRIMSRQLQCCQALGINMDGMSSYKAKTSWSNKNSNTDGAIEQIDSLVDALNDVD